MSDPFEPVADGVRVALRVTPRASRNAVAGCRTDAAGRTRLAVQVTAVPEKGKANAAVTRLLAKSWWLPPGALVVESGATDRNKTIRVVGEPADLLHRLKTWLHERSADAAQG